MLYYLAVIREYLECNKYKKLYEEEKQKYQDLKKWAEGLVIKLNPDFLKDIEVIELQSK
jgi:hypothetical protein